MGIAFEQPALGVIGPISRKVGSGTWLSENAAQFTERIDADIDINAPHTHSFIETIDVRLVLEPGVAALAARHVTEVHIKLLNQALDAILMPRSWIDFKSRIYQFSRAC